MKKVLTRPDMADIVYHVACTTQQREQANMDNQQPTFQIRITKTVTFRDLSGSVLAFFPAGTVINASARTQTTYITPWGGIYFDEAEAI